MTAQATYYIIRALVALVAIPFHEAGHALAAWLLGDATAKREGRLSLNPFAHFDLLGTLCMVFAGVGWAKPVSTNPRNFKNPKWGMALTALAGPVANLVLAYLGGVQPDPRAAAGRQPHFAGGAAAAHLFWPDAVRKIYHDRYAGGGLGRLSGCAAVLPEQRGVVAFGCGHRVYR